MASKQKILIVDDDNNIAELISLYLTKECYDTKIVNDGEEAVREFHSFQPNLILLDLMLPGGNGLDILRDIRKQRNPVGVIIVSAKDSLDDKVKGLEIGADDYLAKPFNPLEAVARVNSNIRRFYALGTAELSSNILTVRDLELDPEGCVLKKNGEPIELTSVEYRIMELFMKHPGKVFTKQQIYEQGWGDTYVVADNNIMVCISKLRAKLDEDPAAYIRTIRGLGYRLEK